MISFYRGGSYSLPFFVWNAGNKQPVRQKEIRYLMRFFREGYAFHAAFA